jgi:hypothetical protein
MDADLGRETGIIGGEQSDSLEAMVLGKERWIEVRRLQGQEGLSVSEIARRLEIGRKTQGAALRMEGLCACGAQCHVAAQARCFPAHAGGRGELLGTSCTCGALAGAIRRPMRPY